MKRKRNPVEMMGSQSQIKSAIEELSMFPAHHHNPIIPTGPFLHVCNLVIQVLDKIGPTMEVLRQDITQNIQRVEVICESDSSLYSNLVNILEKEAQEGGARKGPSCSKALVWLTRYISLDFTAALLQRLAKNLDQNMEEVVEESYSVTLKPWHGWISSAAFKVALKLVPDNKTFISLLMPKDQDYDHLKEDLLCLVSLLLPVLQDMHSILTLYGLDKLKST